MRFYHSSWWSRLLWGCWQVAVIGFFLLIAREEQKAGRDPKVGAALMIGIGAAWLSTAVIVVGRDIIRDGYKEIRDYLRNKSSSLGRVTSKS